jgi:hypothetical protein
LPEGAQDRLRKVGAPVVVDKGVGMDAVVEAVKVALGV